MTKHLWYVVLLGIGVLLYQQVVFRQTVRQYRQYKIFSPTPYADPSANCWRVESGISAHYVTTGIMVVSLDGPCFESRAACEQADADDRLRRVCRKE